MFFNEGSFRSLKAMRSLGLKISNFGFLAFRGLWFLWDLSRIFGRGSDAPLFRDSTSNNTNHRIMIMAIMEIP